jgi:hypothetical protein
MSTIDKEYLEQLNKAYLVSSSQFDKQILVIASGALGISFAFIKDIVKISVAECNWLIITSWSLFSLLILMSIISHYTSMKAINIRIRNLENNNDKVSEIFNKLTKILNVLMLVFLFLGLGFLIVFIGINI